MPRTFSRDRRPWTETEDKLLRDAVNEEEPDNSNPTKWHAIAKHVPQRTNKDCRKRWFAKMGSNFVKGGWSPDENAKLEDGVERYGTRWTLVASVVKTRNSDQCAKRWTDTLDPAIVRTTWSTEADEILLNAVAKHGNAWAHIVKTYLPGRTGLSAKNRYNSVTRAKTASSRTPRIRKKAANPSQSRCISESTSSASSSTPSVDLSNQQVVPYDMDFNPTPHDQLDVLSTVSQSPSGMADLENPFQVSHMPATFDFSWEKTLSLDDHCYASPSSSQIPTSFPDLNSVPISDSPQSSPFSTDRSVSLAGVPPNYAGVPPNYSSFSQLSLAQDSNDMTPNPFTVDNSLLLNAVKATATPDIYYPQDDPSAFRPVPSKVLLSCGFQDSTTLKRDPCPCDRLTPSQWRLFWRVFGPDLDECEGDEGSSGI